MTAHETANSKSTQAKKNIVKKFFAPYNATLIIIFSKHCLSEVQREAVQDACCQAVSSRNCTSQVISYCYAHWFPLHSVYHSV